MSGFWDSIGSEIFENEASVEMKLVLPLLGQLGYDLENIAPKYPVIFQEGRVGRRPEADFVVFSGSVHNRNTSLIVVEAKSPTETLEKAKAQAESYASNLRVPFYMLCNGIDLQVWQLQAVMECECVLDIKVSCMAVHRGEIESLLGREVVLSHCAGLAWKSVKDNSVGFERYLNSELRRFPKDSGVVDRTLTSVSGEGEGAVKSDSILESVHSAVVVGPSGFGKTILAGELIRRSLKNAVVDPDSILPVDVQVPDFIESGQSLFDYIHARLSAHAPGFTEAALRDHLRERGILLVCDAYERVGRNEQKSFDGLVRVFSRDYPLTRIFLFSRNNSRPNINVPVFRLDELSAEQRYEVRSRASSAFERPDLLWSLPEVLERLCWHPLLLQLIIDFIVKHRRQPIGIDSLFESWLLSIIDLGGCAASDVSLRERALSIIATETSSGPISAISLIESFKRDGLGAETYDFLVDCDALSIRGRLVELQHEALADYLRVLKITRLEDSEIKTNICSVQFKEESFFPILLMSQLKSRDNQRLLWRRIAELDISTYLSVLRFQATITEEANGFTPKQRCHNFLEDILDGVSEPLSVYFLGLREALTRRLSGGQDGELAISGYLVPSPFQVGHSVGVIGGDFPQRVNVQERQQAGEVRHYLNVEASGLRTDNGREIGVGLLYGVLLRTIKARQFLGGPLLANDRAIGRLRALRAYYGFEFDGLDLPTLEKMLAPHDGEYACIGHYVSGENVFPIKEIIGDIRLLIGMGINHLDYWWSRLGGLKSPEKMSESELSNLLDEHYRRTQLLYKEIVENSFPGLFGKLRAFPLLPLRWTLAVLRDGSFGRPTVYFRWEPVGSWSEAGAIVSFENGPPHWNFDENWAMVRARLISLGRPSDRGIGTHGFCPFPDFDGSRMNGIYDGETSALREACDMLVDDMKDIFRDVKRSSLFE